MNADKYTFFATFPDGVQQIYPKNKTFTFKFQETESAHFKYKVLDTELILRGDDFMKFYVYERAKDVCQEFPLLVLVDCEGTQYVEFEGKFALIDGDWNPRIKRVDIKPRAKNDSTCITDNWEEELNIFSITSDRITATSFIGELQFTSCFENQFVSDIYQAQPVNGCLSGAAWGMYSNTVTAGDLQDGNGNFLFEVLTFWVREIVTSPTEPPGEGWIQEGSDWVRSVNLVFDAENSTESETQIILQYFIPGTIGSGTTFTEAIEMDNGMSTAEVGQSFLDRMQCGLTLVSNFLGVNPDGTAPTNEEYMYALEYLQYVTLYNLTDVIRFDATENATIQNLTFKRYLEIHKLLFDLEWTIEDDVFRLEHPTYWPKERRIDMTAPELVDRIKDNFNYKYDKTKRPKQEDWQFGGGATIDFIGTPIRYPQICANEDTEEETYNLTEVFTDFNYVQQLDRENLITGLFVAGLDFFQGNYILNQDFGLLSGTNVLNARVSKANLLESLHKHNRPHINGTLNGKDIVFSSSLRTRRQPGFILNICCTDWLIFKADYLVKAQLGWGEMVDPEYDTETEQLKFDLLND